MKLKKIWIARDKPKHGLGKTFIYVHKPYPFKNQNDFHVQYGGCSGSLVPISFGLRCGESAKFEICKVTERNKKGG